MIPECFATARLRAERMSEAHFGELRVFHQDARMMALIGGVRDAAGTAAYLDRHLVQWRAHGFGFWVLHDAETGASAGTAGLRWLAVHGTNDVEVGYGFMPAYWGRGLATEIARACVDLAFQQLAVTSVVAVTDAANHASQQVLRKVGLVYERDVTHEGRTSMLFRGNQP